MEDVAALCMEHRDGSSLCVDYILAMVEYDRFMNLCVWRSCRAR